VYENPRGPAMFTQVVYYQNDADKNPGSECPDPSAKNNNAMAFTFVRGLVTPVALPASDPNGSKDTGIKCIKESSSDKWTKTWSCGGGSSGQSIKINILGWPTSSTSFAVLSLTGTQENEIFPGSFVVDQAVIPPEVEAEHLDLALKCYGESIALLISNNQPNGYPIQWAYLIGAKAMGDLIHELEAKANPEPKEGDPMSWLNDKDSSVSTWMLEAPAMVFEGIRGSIVRFISPSAPRPLCPPPAASYPDTSY
jgi:hypothetical protein